MQTCVFGSGHQLQICYFVVAAVVVNVMHNFVFLEAPPDVLLNENNMKAAAFVFAAGDFYVATRLQRHPFSGGCFGFAQRT